MRVEGGDSIARRFRLARDPAESKAGARWHVRWLLPGVPAVIMLILAPQLLVFALALPLIILSLLVLTPLLLPLIALWLGALLTSEIISGIARERQRHTWQLLCACPDGALRASVSCAIGFTQGTNWLLPLRFLALMTLRVGAALWILLLALGLWLGIGVEQAWLLWLLALCLALYFALLAQTLWLAALCGLWASAFDLSRADATLAGLCLYLAVCVMPLLAGFWLAGRGLALEAALMLVALRELCAWMMWRGLRWRLE